MTKCNKKLKLLIEDTVMPDIEDAIDDIFEEIVANKKGSKEQENELKEHHELREEFTQILEDIDNNELEEDECEELLEEINEMINENQE
jgi:hypothetical protein